MSSRNVKRRNSASLKDESKPKRAKPNDEPAVFEWEDKGTIQPDGSVEHNRLEVTMGKDSFIIMVGDSILLRNQDTVRTDDAPSRGAYVARVEKMWQGLPKKRGVPAKMMLQARWYFKVLSERKIAFVLRFRIHHSPVCFCRLLHPTEGRFKGIERQFYRPHFSRRTLIKDEES